MSKRKKSSDSILTPIDVLNLLENSITQITEGKKSGSKDRSNLQKAVEIFESVDLETEFSGLFLDARETVPKVRSILNGLVELDRHIGSMGNQKEKGEDSHIQEEELNGTCVRM